MSDAELKITLNEEGAPGYQYGDRTISYGQAVRINNAYNRALQAEGGYESFKEKYDQVHKDFVSSFRKETAEANRTARALSRGYAQESREQAQQDAYFDKELGRIARREQQAKDERSTYLKRVYRAQRIRRQRQEARSARHLSAKEKEDRLKEQEYLLRKSAKKRFAASTRYLLRRGAGAFAGSAVTRATGSPMLGTLAGTAAQFAADKITGSATAMGAVAVIGAMGGLALAVDSLRRTFNNLSDSVMEYSGDVRVAKVRGQYADMAAMMRRASILGPELAKWEDLKTSVRTGFQDVMTGFGAFLLNDLKLVDRVNDAGNFFTDMLKMVPFLKEWIEKFLNGKLIPEEEMLRQAVLTKFLFEQGEHFELFKTKVTGKPASIPAAPTGKPAW